MKPLSHQNLYEILDLPLDASVSAIAEAVERAQALYAPGSLATYTLMDPEEERLLSRLIEEARTTLLDPAARARYDERLAAPEQPSPPPAPSTGPSGLDAAIRVAWPELPPVIPAAPIPVDDEWDEEPPASAPLPQAAPRESAPQSGLFGVGHPASGESPAMVQPRVAPILLSREVAPAAVPAPPPPPSVTPVPMVPPAATPATTPAPEATSWSGEVLRKLREARGISLQQISERTKVTRRHIENIEADRFESLPAAVYLRGILLSIARELRLDGPKVARSYLERVSAACSTTAPLPRQR
ncbi:MAG TPA: helix-turn-helix transcriptional regulator [Anaeromyxobacter sp.]|nr:helix-turn-helix transcriptional regulator [Anaeromyxobacter sp.]